jgi:hypothetical protein
MASISRQELRGVEGLDLSGCPMLSDLSPLQPLRNLTRLSLNNCTGVSDIRPLAGLKRLRELYLEGCLGITNLDGLQSCENLRILFLGASAELTPLKDLKCLEDLHLHYTDSGKTDLTPLAKLRSLRHICNRREGAVAISEELRSNPQQILSEGLMRLIFGPRREGVRRVANQQGDLPFRFRGKR